MKSTTYLLALMFVFLFCCMVSCSGNKQKADLDNAESLMETHPDSALVLLEGIEKSDLGSKEERARYALLMSMALDKNYIDTVAFDVLQPAIDYYLKHGDANEKLRTYYYQGRIYQNQGDRDNALNSFVKGIDNSTNYTDSLTFVRALVAQAYLYYEFYDFDSYINANLRAAKICKKLSNKSYEFNCLINALNGAIVLNNQNMSDSLINLCNSFELLNEEQNITLLEHRLSYVVKFGSKKDIASLLIYRDKLLELDSNCVLNLASAYNKLGDNQVSKELLDYISSQENSYDTLKYQSIYVTVLKDLGDYKNALSTYEIFSQKVDELNSIKFDQKSQSIEEKHILELKAQQEASEKAKIIWSCIGGIVLLVLLSVILFLLLRSNKSQKELAVERAKSSELENKSLKIEKENLAHRVKYLEDERANLKELMDAQNELPSEVRQTIKVRIEMLNALMARYITDNEKYGEPYESWIKELTDNTEEFMNSNRLAFQASHPRFIKYFEDHGLTVGEINYVCLYALGLKGKEVGSYMKMRSHVNISSGIRKKLGIDKHETNIGIYVRKLLKEL